MTAELTKPALAQLWQSLMSWLCCLPRLLFTVVISFFTVASAQQLFWGILLLLTFQAQVGTKLWIWLETNRRCQLRELKRLELAL